MKVTEQNFIQLLKQRNEKALEYVVDEYSGLLKSVIAKNLRYMQGYQEECLDDVLMAIWNNIDSFQPEKNGFKNWIVAIAKYKSINYFKKYSRQLSELSLDDVEYEHVASQEYYENDISEKMEELLSGLSPKDRELFHRLYVNQEPMDSVSKAMDLSKPVIYNRLSRAKKKLRKRGKSL